MIYPITNPKGIDLPISKLQAHIHSALLIAWGLSANEYKCYARCYRQKLNDGYIPAVFDGLEYKDVFGEDTLAAQSFFGVSEREQYKATEGAVADVHLVFFVNLSRLSTTKDLAHRGDVEARVDVTKLVNRSYHGFTLTGFRTGIDNVYAEYNGPIRDRMYKADIKQFHCFRLDFTLRYNPLECAIAPLGLQC